MVRRSIAGEGRCMSPPRWLDAALRGMLNPRERDTISGDLWEAYCKDVLPAKGVLHARLWYLRQMVSLASWQGIGRLTGSVWRRIGMSRNAAIAWISGGVLALSLIVFVLIRSRFAPPFAPGVAMALAAVPAAAAMTALRPLIDLWPLGRAAMVWAAALATAICVRFAVDWLIPFNVEDVFVAQAKAGWPELHEPRRFLFGLAIAMLLIAAGCHGAWRTGQARSGILTAMTAGLLVVAPVFVIVALRQTTSAEVVAPFAMLAIATLLGTVGAMTGKGLHGLRPRISLPNPVC